MKCVIRTVSIFVLSILVFLPLMPIAADPGAQKDKLIGHWTFEKGEELKDRFGPLPWQTINLLLCKRLKIMAPTAGIESITKNFNNSIFSTFYIKIAFIIKIGKVARFKYTFIFIFFF